MTSPTQTPGAADRPVGDLVRLVTRGPLPFRLTAYDGTDVGPPDAAIALRLTSREGLVQLLTAPGDLGLVRAYLTGTLLVDGVHPGDPYPLFVALKRGLTLRRPDPAALARLLWRVGPRELATRPALPTVEGPPWWRRRFDALSPRHRAARAISHHYDVSNAFYERVLGPSMAYTCAVYPSHRASLEAAQENKYRLVAQKLALRPGQRLLDVGCGWGSMVRYAARECGVRAVGVTLSREQAAWAQAAIEAEGLGRLAEVRHLDYRQVPPERYDAISSIGLTEHIGARNYPSYAAFLRSRLLPGGRLLNHCITRPDPRDRPRPEAFTDRYVFPDGELVAVGPLVTRFQEAGLEVEHVENLREHYALTLAAWSANLREHWDGCVADAGAQTAQVWGLYLAGSRFGFESNWFQLHQVLATNPCPDGRPVMPLRPDWRP